MTRRSFRGKHEKTAFFLFVLLLSPNITLAKINTFNDSFNKAKRLLQDEVYYDHQVTLYCGYEYDDQKRICLPDGFIAEKHQKRSYKIEWEHSVPAENFGRAFTEWREGHPLCVDNKGKSFKGRKCAEKVNKTYRYMQSDMYNLFPAVGSVNAARSNKQYSELPGVQSAFGTCEAKIDGNRFEPPDRAKGQVARAALYMDKEYKEYNLSRQQRRLFEAWSNMYPVDEWECTRAKRIESIQGNENIFVKNMCIEKGLW